VTFDPRLLRSFVVVAEELSFARAAERLHVAKPALSQQIARLERQLGVELLARSTRSVELTAAGAAFLEHAREAVSAGEAAARAAGAVAAGTAGTVRLTIDVDTPPSVRAAIGEFQREHPDVDLRVVVRDYPDGLADLETGAADGVIGWVGREQDGLIREVILVAPVLAGMHERHVQAGRDAMPPAVFGASPIALFARELGPEVVDHLVGLLERERGGPVEVQVVPNVADSMAAMTDAVARDARLATFVLADYWERSPREGVVVMPFDPPLGLELVLFRRRGHPVLARLLEALRRVR
jgi:DNA-binding transcriptional LysR family regulator